MHPILLSFGDYHVRAYTVFSILAMLVTMIPVRAEARRLGWDVRASTWLVVQCTLIGFVGAHVLYALTRFDMPWDQWWRLLLVRWGFGSVWFGGFLASWAWVHHWARRRGIPVFRMYDVACFAVLIAQATGRIGCVMGGCCYGAPTTVPWAITLPTREYGTVGVHPVALYETIFRLALFAVLWRARARNACDGLTAARYLVWSSAGRFALELLRGDTVRGFVAGWLSTSQLIALGLVATGLAFHVVLRRRRAAAPVTATARSS